MGDPDLKDGMSRREKIAALAGAITEMHLNALKDLAAYDVTWLEVTYASIISLRSLAEKYTGPDGDDQLARITVAAMADDLVEKRFRTEADFRAWARAEGLDPDGLTEATKRLRRVKKPGGNVH